nr:unnamed protein product [Callosobruchus chinensis]
MKPLSLLLRPYRTN